MNEPTSVFRNVQTLMGPVYAGFPSPAEDYAEKPLDLDELVVSHPVSTYYMRIVGDSMIGACIYPNDVIVVDRALTAGNNRLVVARLGAHLTLKRLQIVKPKRIFLKSENPAYPPLEVKQRDDFEIWGVVTWVVHALVSSRPHRDGDGRAAV
jgi:DNA polymerase V